MADVNYLEEFTRMNRQYDVTLSVPSEGGFYGAQMFGDDHEIVAVRTPCLATTLYAFVDAVLVLEDEGAAPETVDSE